MGNLANAENPGDQVRVQRIPQRGHYDRATINAILDEALICHVAFVDNDQPFVIPTIPLRIDDELYLHGSRASRMLKVLATGAPLSVCVTHVDGLVLARSAFHHSMNYRSVVVVGRGREVTDFDHKQHILNALTDHVVPGRSADARMPTRQEIAATRLIAIPITEASAKIRSGPPVDDDKDYDLPIWAGVIPLKLSALPAEADPRLAAGIDTPEYAVRYPERRSSLT